MCSCSWLFLGVVIGAVIWLFFAAALYGLHILDRELKDDEDDYRTL